MSDSLIIAKQAWESVRKPEDGQWDALPMEIRHKLIRLAEKYMAGRPEAVGDYAPLGFFKAVRVISSGADVSVGDSIIEVDSRSPMMPRGITQEVKSPAREGLNWPSHISIPAKSPKKK